MGVGSDRDPLTAEFPVAGDCGRRGIRLSSRLAEAARVDLERGPTLHQRAQGRFDEFGGGREIRRRDMGREIPLHEVDMPDGIKEPGPGGRLDLVEVGRDDVRQGSTGHPGFHATGDIRRVGPDVDRPDDEVVHVLREVMADRVFPDAFVREFDAEPDRQAQGFPAVRSFAHGATSLLERRVGVRGRARVEVDVIGDGDLRDAELDRLARVRLDAGVAIRREGRMQVGIQRQASPSPIAARAVHAVHPAMMPSSRPTVEKAWSAWSSCDSAWAAVTIVRSLDWSMATVGKTTG
jgi:hypothetical protein